LRKTFFFFTKCLPAKYIIQPIEKEIKEMYHGINTARKLKP
jgi:hypothetical protein